MRNLIIPYFLLLTSTFVFSQTFEDGYKKGYGEGYCYGQAYCTPPLSPLAPMPSLGQDTFTDGYNLGFLEGKESNMSSTPSTYESSESNIVYVEKDCSAMQNVFASILYMSEKEYERGNFRQAGIYFELLDKTELSYSPEIHFLGAKCYLEILQSNEKLDFYEEVKKKALKHAQIAKKVNIIGSKEVLKAIKKL